MSSTTVAEFASELKKPTDTLLEQLRSAGVEKSAASDVLTDGDKQKLLGYLQAAHGTAAPERKKMFQHMNNLTIPLVMDDTEALLKFIDGQSAASKGPMGAVGYCMSGQYAINAAARWPDRIVAAASIYGTRLITDEPHSPHLSAQKVSGEIYIGCAEHDSYVPQEMIAELQATIRDKNINAELEVYPGVHHGFAFPQRTIYDKAAAEKHWERLLSLYRRKLG